MAGAENKTQRNAASVDAFLKAVPDELGKHRTGKSCLYVKRLAEVDRDVLEELIAESLQFMRERYPDDA